jgi:hypothetical protein
MSIKNYVDELEQIQAEIKRNNTHNRFLRQRVKELEANIAEYLAQKGQHGLKYKGRAVILEQKERRPAKKKKDKEADIISLFEELGVDDPQGAYTRLVDTQKGDPVEQRKIKFKKLPKF